LSELNRTFTIPWIATFLSMAGHYFENSFLPLVHQFDSPWDSIVRRSKICPETTWLYLADGSLMWFHRKYHVPWLIKAI
jgi:hypothetical protein